MSLTDNVSPLETVHEAEQVYGEFFEVFGSPLLDETGEVASHPLLPPRVLHFDETELATHCLSVHIHVRRRLLFSHGRRDHNGDHKRHSIYDARDYRVASCDGQSITDWLVQSAHGVHHGLVNGIDKPFDPAKEELGLIISHPHDDTNKLLRLQIWPVSQLGTVELGNDRLGWILDEHSSRQRHEQLLGRSHTSAIGRTAIAS